MLMPSHRGLPHFSASSRISLQDKQQCSGMSQPRQVLPCLLTQYFPLFGRHPSLSSLPALTDTASCDRRLSFLCSPSPPPPTLLTM